MKLSKDEREQAAKTIRNCDKLFDGYYSEGFVIKDRELAYNTLRTLARELLEKDAE